MVFLISCVLPEAEGHPVAFQYTRALSLNNRITNSGYVAHNPFLFVRLVIACFRKDHGGFVIDNTPVYGM